MHSPPILRAALWSTWSDEKKNQKEPDRILEGWAHFLCLWNAEECVLSLCSDFLHSVTNSFIHLQKIGFGSAEKKTFCQMSAKAHFLLINSTRRYIYIYINIYEPKHIWTECKWAKIYAWKKVNQVFKNIFKIVNCKRDLKHPILHNSRYLQYIKYFHLSVGWCMQSVCPD